jgi:hypothetical protein
MANPWVELGVVKAAAEFHSSPAVMRVSRNKETGDLSYEFGLLISGQVKIIRHWNESRIYSLTTLAKAAAALALSTTLSGLEITPEAFERVIANSPMLVLVENHMTPRQEKQAKSQRRFGATIGDRLKKA